MNRFQQFLSSKRLRKGAFLLAITTWILMFWNVLMYLMEKQQGVSLG